MYYCRSIGKSDKLGSQFVVFLSDRPAECALPKKVASDGNTKIFIVLNTPKVLSTQFQRDRWFTGASAPRDEHVIAFERI